MSDSTNPGHSDLDDATSSSENDVVEPEILTEPYFPFGFTLSGESWDLYHVWDLVRDEKNIEAEPSLYVLRQLVHRINLQRQAAKGEPALHAGQLLALSLLTEIMRYVIDVYAIVQNPEALKNGRIWTKENRQLSVDGPIHTFASLFPPIPVKTASLDVDSFLTAESKSISNKDKTSRELILLGLGMENPALKSFRSLFDDRALVHQAPYRPALGAMEAYFATQEPVEHLDETLFEVLRGPMKASPDSLEGQLDFIRTRWKRILPKRFMKQLLVTKGVLREETATRGGGPGEPHVLRFGKKAGTRPEDFLYPEPERFTEDRDWMSNVVIIAKSTWVWLDQLSRHYGREITRLDQIPDAELEQLSRWGFSGLWLIGLWERSSASQEIKRRMGNPEAMSSAYSLYDYVVAHDLGGSEAYEHLRDRAARYGIRLASDMVPNHTGIYSNWVINHPDWFVHLDHPPYPNYSYTGPSLSQDDRVTIQIEDGYWNHSDAAVVFKRIDNATGHTQYIYHGNDGTSMPWNDTAQLNYLLPEVREAVIQTILHVARMFPIIRFDAAMTLAKKHFQRLWFPLPGEGGAIPSRAEHSMTRAEFEEKIPAEFWREVVDRIQQEVPETLLLAEAFWLMEGYFVRTLGMHRVYNSAFMNMLKMEENSKYRDTIKNVLEYSPQILRRFVNFMNNPDERTAVEQFGKGDKYIGVALMMVTMPGLPMFGHGQIEGFTEKYGMEYRRAYQDESPDYDLIRRHEHAVFPLMRRRHLFSHVENFHLFDFWAGAGHVDENVFAYSNMHGDERAVIFYNNAYSTTSGWISLSCSSNLGSADEPRLAQRHVGDALQLRNDAKVFYIFRDHRENLQYIRAGNEIFENGLFVNLSGYQFHAFVDWDQVTDEDGVWRHLAERLQGAGVPDMYIACRETILAPYRDAYRAYVSPAILADMAKTIAGGDAWTGCVLSSLENLGNLLDVVGREQDLSIDSEEVFANTTRLLQSLREFAALPEQVGGDSLRHYVSGMTDDDSFSEERFWHVPLLWALTYPLRCIFKKKDAAEDSSWLDEWLFTSILVDTLAGTGREQWEAQFDAQLTVLLVHHAHSFVDLAASDSLSLWLEERLNEPRVQEYLEVNLHEGTVWLSKEQLERVTYWMVQCGAVIAMTEQDKDKAKVSRTACYAAGRRILETAAETGYRVEEALKVLQSKTQSTDQ